MSECVVGKLNASEDQDNLTRFLPDLSALILALVSSNFSLSLPVSTKWILELQILQFCYENDQYFLQELRMFSMMKFLLSHLALVANWRANSAPNPLLEPVIIISVDDISFIWFNRLVCVLQMTLFRLRKDLLNINEILNCCFKNFYFSTNLPWLTIVFRVQVH
jgi:hypothetical protein